MSESVEMTCNDSNAEVGSSLQNSITLMCSENGTFIPHSSFDEVKIDSLKKDTNSSSYRNLKQAEITFFLLLQNSVGFEIPIIFFQF